MIRNYTLYLVTDSALMTTNTLSEAVEQAILGGCTMVQLREKTASSLDCYLLAKEVKEVTAKYGVPLIINDRIDIALAIGADGVHLGQRDIPASAAREIIGKEMILGVSAASMEQACKAVADGADYLGVGAMFPTGTKSDAELVSIDELKNIRKSIDIPIVAIGGISVRNAALFKETGVDGLAVVSAVIGQQNIKSAASVLKDKFVRGITDEF